MLGLLLCYLGSQMTIKWLCLIFGITPSPCSRILKKILGMTVKRLRYHPLARISFPDEHKMRVYADMIKKREPTIDNVIGFMDGLGLATEMTSKRIEQNAYDPTHIHPTSMSYILKVFDNLYMIWMCIWMCPQHITATHADQAFWNFAKNLGNSQAITHGGTQ